VEESKNAQTYVDRQEGMLLEHGYMSDFMCTDFGRMEANYDHPYILVTDKEINSIVDLSGLLNQIHEEGKGLVIISPSISGEALQLLIQNKMQGVLPVLAIKAPAFGEVMKAMLGDIAALTGANFITEDAGHKLKDIKLSDLGIPESVSANKKSSLIIGGKGHEESIKTRIESIDKQLEDEEDDFKLVKLKERKGKLTDGIAVIYAGGSTEIEMKERLERLDDATHATRAAMQGGIIPGGEIIFLRIREILGQSEAEKILYNALEIPYNKLVSNAGADPGESRVWLQKMQEENKDYGLDVTDMEYKNLMDNGIIDPCLVAEKAMENAVSVAIALITTGQLIVPIIPESKSVKK
ncbi:MAG: TCP-1/cpn60 chaperonin family protein, partial [Candidatus Dormibacteria bacterium]